MLGESEKEHYQFQDPNRTQLTQAWSEEKEKIVRDKEIEQIRPTIRKALALLLNPPVHRVIKIVPKRY